MIPLAFSLQEAMEHFLSNSSGAICCRDGKRERVVNSYPEAEEFFQNQP